ncbi:MAG: hypothetical protein KBS42_01265 [Bacteroidales bacterium]|nr:hypothetical protein [Candidatus Colicola coprequi]
MKKISFVCLLTMLWVSCLTVMGQARKPELMVFPSESWCINNGYYTEVTNMDYVQKVPAYREALQSNTQLKMAIAKINDLFAERQFPLEDLEQTLKNIEQERAEDNLTVSKNGNELAETPLDQLSRTAKADIILELTWELNDLGAKHSLTYILEAKDAYTSKTIGAVSGVGAPSMSADVATLLEEAIVANMDGFQARIMDHFAQMQEMGREVRLDIKVFDNNAAGVDLETEYGDDELVDILNRWMAQNTVSQRFSVKDASETHINYTQVRIPLYDDYGIAMDAAAFAKKLQKALKKEPFQIPSKVVTKGLGRAVLIIGEK